MLKSRSVRNWISNSRFALPKPQKIAPLNPTDKLLNKTKPHPTAMDPSSLAKLVAEQAQVIEQLKLERETASQTLKEEILSSLRHDLRPKRRKKKVRKAINRSLEESYSDIEVDYDDDGEEYLDESSLVSSSSKTNSMIVRSSSTNNMTGRSVGRSGLSSTTGRKVIKRAPSSGSASVTTSVTQNR